MTHDAPPPPLTEAEGRALLERARAAILDALRGHAAGPAGADTGALTTFRAIFVTLRSEGRLRGCIGLLRPSEPLGQAIRTCARAAAFDDPRFAPLEAHEAAGLALEVSVLGPRSPLDAPEALRLGDEGLVVTHGGRSGLLLPQVAIEQGWDAREFLAQACRKAGLAPDAWREGARVERFSAQVFREEPAGP